MKDIRFDGKLNYTINNIGFVNVLRNKNHIVPFRNGKASQTLVLVADGEMNYYFTDDQKSVKLFKGEVLFVPQSYPYIVTYMQDNTIAKVLSFDINSNNLPAAFRLPVHKKEPGISEICESISGEKANSITFLAAKIYELLYVLEKENTIIPYKYKKIIPAVNEIKQMYFENKKISYYADMCFISESNFRKLFKEYTGKSPIEYRNLIRISQAKKMINSGEFTVTEAAYLTGFNNMSFFYEVYNRLSGR